MATNQWLLLIALIGCFIVMYFMESSESVSDIPTRIEEMFKNISRWINRQ